jgi:hypothetical protein
VISNAEDPARVGSNAVEISGAPAGLSCSRGTLHVTARMCRQLPRPHTKEVHFFNRWPLPPAGSFLRCFEPALSRRLNGTDDGSTTGGAAVSAGHPWLPPEFAMVDGTPEYLFNSWVPARLKVVVPQARFVVVLRVRSPHWWAACPQMCFCHCCCFCSSCWYAVLFVDNTSGGAHATIDERWTCRRAQGRIM